MKSWGQLQHQKMINKLDFERRKRYIRRWWYDLQDDGLDLASLMVGVTALLFIIGTIIYQVSLYLGRHP